MTFDRLRDAKVKVIRQVDVTDFFGEDDDNDRDFCRKYAQLSNEDDCTYLFYCPGWVADQAKKAKKISKGFKELILTAAEQGAGGSDLGWLWLYVN